MSSSSTRPFLVETDEGRFVLKLVGGADGPRALAAEWLGAKLCGAVGLPALDVVALELESDRAASVADGELREMVERGAGLCLGSRELSGARTATLLEIEQADDDFALRLLWLDILIENPDRRVQNPNVLRWGGSLIPVDHASAFPFHHDFRIDEARPSEYVGAPQDHVYRARASDLPKIHAALWSRLDRESLEAFSESIPDEWLGTLEFSTFDRQRTAYAAYLWKRLRALDAAWAHEQT